MLEDANTPQLSVLGFVGSLRQQSFNRQLMHAALELAPPSLRISVHEIGDIPFYNQDVEAPERLPASVAALRDAVRAADGLLFATPEYNYGLPAVLKNAIDWASRPVATSALRRKPAAVMGASTGNGGTVRAQLVLRQAFLFNDMPALLQPEVIVPRCAEKFSAGRLTDEQTRGFVKKMLEAFEGWIRLLQQRAAK
jgi:chromate reductase